MLYRVGDKVKVFSSTYLDTRRGSKGLVEGVVAVHPNTPRSMYTVIFDKTIDDNGIARGRRRSFYGYELTLEEAA